MSADLNLLFGILALHLDFITRDQLIAAMNAWVLDKNKTLGTIFIEHKVLTAERHALLHALVQEHLRQHQNDAHQSLAAVSSLGSVKNDLDRIADADVHASIAFLPASRAASAAGLSVPDPYATVQPPSIGQPTSGGLRFRILRPHAKGGLGEVFVAHDEELHREVALKEIQDKHADHPESRSRFLLEAEITGGLEHPGIVPVYGLGQYADGRPFYAMRFIRGDSLQDAIKRFHDPLPSPPGRGAGGEGVGQGAASERPVEFRKLLGRFIDVCQAIQYAHDRGVLHRDLKPGNIMLGKYGETLVVDWGLAKAMSEPEALAKRDTNEPPLRPTSGSNSDQTAAGTAIGTPQYMSPEQAAGRLDQLGPASDVYSLGATLYCLLTGKSPIEDKDLASILQKVQRGDVGFGARSASKEVPRPLAAICLKAMALNRSDRYATPLMIANDIEHWLADEPVAAFAEPLPVRARRWARKHPGPVSGIAAAVLVTVVGLAAGFFVLREKNQQLSTANAQLDTANAGLTTSNQNLDAANQTLKTTNEKLDLARNAAEKAADAEKLAADKERAATALAVKRLQQIEKANALMKGIFTDINPRLAEKGGPLLIEQLTKRLLDTADKLDAEAIGDPLAVARLQTFLGSTLDNLGEPKKAIELSAKARTTLEKLLGPDHPDTLNSMNNLAAAYQADGQFAKALPLFEETLAKYQAKLGPDHPDTLISMNNLASAYQDDGQLAKAFPLYEETLARKKAKLGPDHPDTLISMNNLASAYQDDGQLAKAFPLYEETLAKRKAKLGPDHPDTLNSMNSLAEAYRDGGQLAKALPLYEETLARTKAKLGPDHPNTLNSMNNLASAYHADGQLAKALPLHEETLAKRKAKLGPDHPDTLNSMNNLASAYQDDGQLAKALPLYEDTLAKNKAKLGPDHPGTLTSMNNLANAYQADGRLAKALPLYEETLAKYQAKLGPDHPDTLTSMNNLAYAYKADGQLAKALPLYEETLAKRKAKLGPDHPDTLTSMNNLAYAYEADRQLAKALPLYEETLTKRKAKLGPDHPDTLISMENLALAYCEAKLGEKAAPLFTEFVDSQRKRMKPGDPEFAQVLVDTAERLQGAGQFAAAEKHLRECSMLYEKSASWFKFHVESRLGGTLAGQKKYGDAEPLLLNGYKGMKAREKAIPPASKKWLSDAAARLAQLYEATDRQDEADKWRKVVAEHRRQEGKLLDTIHDGTKDLKLPGKLDANAPSLIYQVRLKAGVTYTIDMVSPDQKALDPYLFLRDDKGNTLAEDDDSGGGLNARIVFRCQRDGVYQIRAATFNNGRGEFTLTVQAKE